jgi:hypothetical protein
VDGIENNSVPGEPWWSRSFINSSHCYIERTPLRGFFSPVKDGTFEVLEGEYGGVAIPTYTDFDCKFYQGTLDDDFADCGELFEYHGEKYRYARNLCELESGGVSHWIGFPGRMDDYPNLRFFESSTDWQEYDTTEMFELFANTRHKKIGKFDITLEVIDSSTGSWLEDDYIKLRIRF